MRVHQRCFWSSLFALQIRINQKFQLIYCWEVTKNASSLLWFFWIIWFWYLRICKKWWPIITVLKWKIISIFKIFSVYFCSFTGKIFVLLAPYLMPVTQMALTGSVHTTVALTLERYISVVVPFFRQRNNLKAWTFILPVAVFAITYR